MQSKTLFLMIFHLRSSIDVVLTYSIAAYPVLRKCPRNLTLQSRTCFRSRDSMETEVYVTMHPSSNTLFIFGDDNFTNLKVLSLIQ